MATQRDDSLPDDVVMDETARYSVHLAIGGQPVLVVGGGAVALRRARNLAVCGARVTVVAPDVVDELASLAGVTTERRRYEAGEATRYRFVVAATDDAELNRLVCSDAEGAGVWANEASQPGGGAAAIPAVLRHGPVVVSVGTGGASPGLAIWLRDQIAELLGPEVAVLAELVAEARQSAREGTAQDARSDWRPPLDSGMLELIRHGRILEAKERLSACRLS